LITENYNNDIKIKYIDKRPGDVMHSLADISFAKEKINFDPQVNLNIGIQEYVEWAKTFYSKH
jgi:UDP-glucose 4-epimerase